MAGTLGVATLQTDVNLKGLNSGLKQAESATHQATGKMKEGFAVGLGIGASQAATKAVAAIVQFGKESLAEFQTFEKGISEVFTLMPGMSEQAMGQMKADVIDFGVEVGRTSDVVVPALYQAISAGVPSENVFDFMKIASDAALGGVTDLETAVDGITSAVNAYGVEALSAQSASDLMFTAVKGGKTDFESLSKSLFNVIPTAASVGVEFGNITAAMAAMTSQGVPTNVATTQLRQLLVELSKSGSKAAATFEDLSGKSFRDFIASGGNLQQALQIMERGAAGLGLSLSDLFGSVEAGNAALVLTGAGTAKFAQELRSAENAAGATATAAETMSGTLDFAANRADAATEAFKIAIGEALEPSQKAWLELKTEILGTVTALATAEKQARAIVEANKASADSFSDLTSEARRIIDTLGGFGTLQGILADVTGASRPLRDRLGEISTELARGSRTWAEYEGKMRAIFGASLEFDEVTGRIIVNNREVGFTVLGMTEAVEGQIGALYRLRDAELASSSDMAHLGLQNMVTAESVYALTDNYIRQKDAVVTLTGATGQHITAMQQAAIAAAETNDNMVSLGEFATTTGAAVLGLAGNLEAVAASQAGPILEAQAEAARAAAAAAEEMRLAEEALSIQLGNYFTDALTAEGQTASLERQLFDTASQAGLSAEQLVVLAAATGDFTDAEIEAAFQAALMRANIDTLVAAMQSGEITAGNAERALRLLKDGEVATADEAINLANRMAGVGGALGDAATQAGNLTNSLNSIPTEINVDINVTEHHNVGGDNQPPSQYYQSGGYTGHGPADEMAGFVHRNELVIPGNVLAAGPAAMLDFASREVPGGRLGYTSPMTAPTRSDGRTSSNGQYYFYGDIYLPGVQSPAAFLQELQELQR